MDYPTLPIGFHWAPLEGPGIHGIDSLMLRLHQVALPHSWTSWAKHLSLLPGNGIGQAGLCIGTEEEEPGQEKHEASEGRRWRVKDPSNEMRWWHCNEATGRGGCTQFLEPKKLGDLSSG